MFRATIASDKYIDLVSEMNIKHRKIYDKIRETTLMAHKKAGYPVADFKEQVIFCKIAQANDIDFIRALVNADKPKGYGSYTIRRPQIQICVKNTSCIVRNKLIEKSE